MTSNLVQQLDMSKTRLNIVPYPSKKKFEDEAHRDDCSSTPFLHIEVWHDTLSTCELFGLIKHDFPPRHLKPTKKLAKLMLLEKLDWVSWVTASSIDLAEKESGSDYSPQIDVWFGKVSRYMYDLWIQWCQRMLERKARWAKTTGGEVYNPFDGLRFRVRVEFHD